MTLTVADLEIRDSAGRALLDGVHLAAARGEVTAVTGASGCGKTTLLRACTGALPPGFAHTRGRIEVLGSPVLGLDPTRLRHLRRSAVAYVGQDPASRLNPRMTVRQLIRETARDADPLPELLARLRLLDLARRRPGQLSGGQARRVALARALAARPALLLLDEPTAGLDPSLRAELAHMLAELAVERDIAVVLSCHDPVLAEHADQILALSHPAPRAAFPTRSPARSPAPDRLTVRDLRVRIEPHPILAGTDLTLPAGGMVALIGASGSGKTTLARAVVGLRQPDRGTIALDGVALPARATRRNREHRRRIQLVPQDPLGSLNPVLTVAQTLARPARLHRIDGPGPTELLAMVDLPAEFAARRPHELSGGQRQRIALARALAARPDVLICDEVTSALDADTAQRLLGLLDRLRREHGLSVLLITHDHTLAARHADTLLELADGRIRETRAAQTTAPNA